MIGHWRAGPDAIRIVSLRLLLHMMGPLLLGCRKQGMHASHVGIHKSFLSKRAQNSSYSTSGLTAYVHLLRVQAWYHETYQHSSKHGMSSCISVKPQRFATMEMNDGLCDMSFMIPSGYLAYIPMGKNIYFYCEKIFLTFKYLSIYPFRL